MSHLFLQPLGNGSFCSNFHWDRKEVPLIRNTEIWEGSDQENWELEGISGKILPVITPLEQTKGLNIEGTIAEMKILGSIRWGFLSLKYTLPP